MKIAGTFSRRAFKVFVLCAVALPLAGCDFFGKPNVYKMPVARAYQKLMAVTIKPSGNGPFYRLDTDTAGNRNKSVEWTAKGSHARHFCVASLTPLEAEQTRVDVSCKGSSPSDGAAAGLVVKMIRKRVIELVDATLKDRPFDPQKADGSTAAFWPDDVIDHGNMATAAARALEMDREMGELNRQITAVGSSRNPYGRR
jgi:hypothetical protein